MTAGFLPYTVDSMRIALLTVGQAKDAALRQAADGYVKRLSRYTPFSEQHVLEEKAPKKRPVAKILEPEGERLIRAIPDHAYVVALDVGGRSVDSEGLSRKIEEVAARSVSTLVFTIGGPFGLSDAILKRADWRFSLSRMTYPHEMARLILLEQLYRAFTIMRGEKYHK